MIYARGMYEEFYGFSDPPFSLTPDPKFFYNGETHAIAFESLRYGIHRGEGFMVVYGGVGTGKTLLSRMVLDSEQHNVYTALLLNPFLSETDLLRAILQHFGVISRPAPPSNSVSTSRLIAVLNTFLISVMQLGGRCVIVIDDAHNIPVPTLEQIRILSNLETGKAKLLQIILIGQPQLKEVLGRPDMRQLNQRISIRCELLPLSRQDMESYIHHRIRVASGGQPRVKFESSSLKTLYEASGGVPRLVNLIADRALNLGVLARATTIDGKLAREAASQLGFQVGLLSRFRR